MAGVCAHPVLGGRRWQWQQSAARCTMVCGSGGGSGAADAVSAAPILLRADCLKRTGALRSLCRPFRVRAYEFGRRGLSLTEDRLESVHSVMVGGDADGCVGRVVASRLR